MSGVAASSSSTSFPPGTEEELATPPLRRAAGSKGSLHSLLQSSSLPETYDDFADAPGPSLSSSQELEWHGASARPPRSSASRLSQSYSQPRTPAAIQERLQASDEETVGELEWLDQRAMVWRRCWCVLKDGFLRCLAPSSEDRREEPDTTASAVRAADAFEAAAVDDELSLEELALSMGERGRSEARLSLTRLALVGTDPHRGEHAFRLVVDLDSGRVERSFRARNRDKMHEWLFAFHRSLAIVVARLRDQKAHNIRGAPSVLFNKKTCWRRTRPGAEAAQAPNLGRSQTVELAGVAVVDDELSCRSDEGAALYRKSSARPRRSRGLGKYVPPHRRRSQAADPFEERGDDVAEPPAVERAPTDHDDDPWCRASSSSTPRLALEWRSGSRCEQGKRRRNEDACVDLAALRVSDEATYGYFGVYDGHSGADAVERCAAELHARVGRALADGESVPTALNDAFAGLDAEYFADAHKGAASLDSGATALACVLEAPASDDCRGPTLVVANCGDCAAVLSRGGRATPLSTAHTPAPGTPEASRILEAGGWITTETDLCVGRLHAMDLDDPEISERAHERVRLNEIHRVCGEVSITRAIGDVDFKGWTPNAPGRPRLPDKCPPAFAYPEGHTQKFGAIPSLGPHDRPKSSSAQSPTSSSPRRKSPSSTSAVTTTSSSSPPTDSGTSSMRRRP